MKRFAHLREDWKLVALALIFLLVIILCYGWGVAKIVTAFENAFGVQTKQSSQENFHIDEAKKILDARQ